MVQPTLLVINKWLSPRNIKEFLRDEVVKWGKGVKASGIKVEQ